MVKIVELEQDSTSWKSSAGVGLAGSELPRKRPKKKKSNADLTGLAGGSGAVVDGEGAVAVAVPWGPECDRTVNPRSLRPPHP